MTSTDARLAVLETQVATILATSARTERKVEAMHETIIGWRAGGRVLAWLYPPLSAVGVWLVTQFPAIPFPR